MMHESWQAVVNMGLLVLVPFLLKVTMMICVGRSIYPNRKKKKGSKGNTEMTSQVPLFMRQ